MQETGPSTQNFSLESATPIEKFNSILTQIIDHVHTTDGFLKQEGLLREAGSVAAVKSTFDKMISDPTAMPLSTATPFKLNPHNVLDLLKKSLKETQGTDWPNDILTDFNQHPDMTVEQLEKNLIKGGYIQQAKALHNIMHLLYLIAKNPENKMTVNNISIAFLPTVSRFLNGLKGLERGITEAYFAESFEQVNPDEEHIIQQDFQQRFPPAKTESGADADRKSSALDSAKAGAVTAYAFLSTNAVKAFNASKGYIPSWLGGNTTPTTPPNFQVGEPQSVIHHKVSTSDIESMSKITGAQKTQKSEDTEPQISVKERVAKIEAQSVKMNPDTATGFGQNEASSMSSPEGSQSASAKWRERATALIDATRTLLTKAQGVLATGVGAAVDFIGKNATRFGKFASEQWVKRPSWLGGKPIIIESPEEPITPPAEKSPLASSTPAAVSPIETPEATASAFDKTWESFLRGGKAAAPGAPEHTPPSPQAQERKDKWIDAKVTQLSGINPNQGFHKLVTVAHESLFSKYLIEDYEVRQVFEILRGAVREDRSVHTGPGIDVKKIITEHREHKSQKMTEKLLASIKNEGKREAINKFIDAVVEAESTAKFGYGSTQDQKKALGQVYDALQGVKKSLKGEDKRPKPFAPQNGQAASSVTRTGSAQEKVADPGSPHHRSKKNP